MPLELWQKYRRDNPCPLCGGFNAGRKKNNNLCKGFRHKDGEHVFCQKTQSAIVTNINGLSLYKHKINLSHIQNESEGPRFTRLVPQAQLIIIYGSKNKTYIVEEERIYEGLVVNGVELPTLKKKWFVVLRDGLDENGKPFTQEITRDLVLSRVRGFC